MSDEQRKNQAVWFEIPCSNLERATRFYGATLACDLEREEGMAVLPHKDVGGALVQSDGRSPSKNGVLLYLNCHGRLDAAAAKALESGGKIVSPKRSLGRFGWLVTVEDTEGNVVGLFSGKDAP